LITCTFFTCIFQTKKQLQNGHSSPVKDVKPNKTPKEPNHSDVLSDKKETNGERKQNTENGENKLNVSSEPTDSIPEKKAGQQPQSSGFGGMKKGFLFGGSTKPKANTSGQNSKSETTVQKTATKTKPKTLEEIPFVKKNEQAQQSNFRFSEVQDAMNKTTEKLMQNKGTYTLDLKLVSHTCIRDVDCFANVIVEYRI